MGSLTGSHNSMIIYVVSDYLYQDWNDGCMCQCSWMGPPDYWCAATGNNAGIATNEVYGVWDIYNQSGSRSKTMQEIIRLVLQLIIHHL